MPEYLKKVYEFFKSSNTAKDVLIGAVSFVAGGYILNKIKLGWSRMGRFTFKT